MSTQQLIIDHLALAATIAGNLSKRLPRHLDPQDLHQDARLGLVSAAARYDARTEVPFGAYARRRIGGAVLDSLRRNDHLTRSTRVRVKAEGSKAPAGPLRLIAPDQIAGVLEAPDRYAADAECRRLVHDAIRTLPARLRVLLHAYYHGEQTMREIGGQLGISASRVSQLHFRALRRLHEHFQVQGITSSIHFAIQDRGPEVRS
jgi:RNA polymerase sigma factor FliA